MLKDLVQYKPVVSVIPNTGIQFLDFGLAIDSVERMSGSFWGQVNESEVDDQGRPSATLHTLQEDEDGTPTCTLPGETKTYYPPEDECYSVRAAQAIELLKDQWLPIPLLRVKDRAGQEFLTDDGPTDWARLFITELSSPDSFGNTHRVTIGIDTLLLERRHGDVYAAPEPHDAVESTDYQLVAEPEKNRFFLALEWVQKWLRESYLEGLSRKQNRQATLDDIQYPGEYWANFMVVLEAVAAGCAVPRVQFTDTITKSLRAEPIDVDLVLDIGNSRTCGILIEQPREVGAIDISNAYRLELRDLSHPEQVYSDPFESRVEFAPAAFGRTGFAYSSKRAGREGFWWPSPVRVGPEAAWLASKNDGTEGISGLSSPKRYLWDTAPRPQRWSNNPGIGRQSTSAPDIRGPMVSRLTEAGDLVDPRKANSVVGMIPRYSRSSLYSLMLAEILIHALGQINSIAARTRRPNSEVPRRLRKLILTLPSATPLAEQKILRQRVRSAVELVWQTMGWEDDSNYRKPDLKLDWDEATCTHLVYLYNEITQKFRGNPRDLFSVVGKQRDGQEGHALRIASMDMGGGTTDLMIIEHQIEQGHQHTVHPQQMFREGFRQAGDDIVKIVVESQVLPAIRNALSDSGVAHTEAFLSDLFGGDHEGMGQQERTLRALLTSQILAPAAFALIEAYEGTDPRKVTPPRHIRYSEIFAGENAPTPGVRSFFEDRAHRSGGTEFSLENIVFVMDPQLMVRSIESVAGKMISDLCDVIRAFDCDVLLLSGRPSRLPEIKNIIYRALPVTPDRIIPMDRYEVGRWYPFRSSDFRIRDPKTTAAVGAALCQICEGITRGFVMRASEIQMRSTARYIGIMEEDGRMLDRNCLLENVDLDTGAGMVEFVVPMEGPVMLGYRQLPLERWKTTPLYALEFKRPENMPKFQTPFRVKLERKQLMEGDSDEVLEDFDVREALDSTGSKDVRNELRLPIPLQTVTMSERAEGGYWLDSGVLLTRGRF